MPLKRMCSMMALIGAKPVPEASSTMGRSDSSRRKKVPKGPSTRRMSFSFIVLKTWSVNTPPGMCRMCSSMPLTPASCTMCGALAIE